MAPRPFIPPDLKSRPFTLEEARALGLTRRALDGKSWRRLARGLYAYKSADRDPWRLLDAWRRNLPPDAAFAGFCSAWLYRLDVDPCNPAEVLVGKASGVRSRKNLVVHHGDLSEVTTVRGLRATTLHRTFRDLRRGLGRFDDLAERAESPMETRLRWSLIQARLPKPQVQVELRNNDGRFLGRADIYYPQARLAIEYDSQNHRDLIPEDNRRQNALLAAGYRLLRFTASDRPDAVGALVRQALA